MYEVRVQGRFSAVHALRLPGGVVEPVHGHDWKVEAVFRGIQLDGAGLLIDFDQASVVLDEVLSELNYANLNSRSEFVEANPSAERVARLIFDRLRGQLGQQAPLSAVYVEEAPGCIAGFLTDAP